MEKKAEAEKEARKQTLAVEKDLEKAQSALIFKEKWEMAKNNPQYQLMLKQHKAHFEK